MFEFIALFIIGLLVASYDAVIGSGGLLLVTGFSLLGVPLLPAIGTMRAISLVQEGVSVLAFWQKLHFNRQAAFFYTVISAIGGFIGALFVVQISEQVLAFIVGIVLLILLVVIHRLDIQDDRELITPIARIKLFVRTFFKKVPSIPLYLDSKTALLAVSCFLLSVYGGFYGAGFGTIALFPFSLIAGLGLIRSAAYARCIGFGMSLAATIVLLPNSTIVWRLFIPLGLGTVIGSWLGVAFATKIRLEYLRTALYVIVVLAALKLLLLDAQLFHLF